MEPPLSASAGWPRRVNRQLLVITLLFQAAVLPYANSITGPWLLDDRGLIAANPAVQDPEQWHKLWTSDYWSVTGASSGLYRPLTMMTYALTWSAVGGVTWPYHLTNMLLHGVVTLLVWRLLMNSGTGLAAVIGGLVFALHPVHVDAVAGIVGRAEVLVALFFLIAVWCHRRALEVASMRGRFKWRIGTGLSLLAMLLSKESGAALLFYFPLEDLARRRAHPELRGWRRAVTGYTVLIVSVGIYLALRLHAIPNFQGMAPAYSTSEHVTLTLTSAAKNLALLLGVGGHQAVWSVPDLNSVEMPMLAAGAGVLLLMMGALVWALRSGRPAALAAGLTALGLLPLLHLVPNVIWVWERGLYAATLGLSWMVYAGLRRLADSGRLSRPIVLALIAGLLLGPGWRTVRWSGLYSSGLRFWAHEYEKDSARVDAALSYSESLLTVGRKAEAIRIRSDALSNNPRSGVLHSALISALASAGMREEARAAIRAAAGLHLEFPSAIQQRQGLAVLAKQAEALGVRDAAQRFHAAAPQPYTQGFRTSP